MPTRYSARDMLARLVSFPTVSSASNLELISFVEDYLAGHGIASTRVPNAAGDKAALHALIGPAVDGGVVLSAHTDVVPVEGQAWSHDAFTLREADGRLYGRGACDMKGFAALMLAGVPDMLAADLKRPIHLALSYDEEVGCLGAPPMIASILESGPKPAMVVVGEPSSMKVITAHKGTAVIRVTARGHSVHSSQWDRGVSAVAAAARVICWLDDQTRANQAAADPSLPMDPPFTTLHCGTVEGGTAQNIVSRSCSFYCDIRTVPGETLEMWLERLRDYVDTKVVPGMQAVHPDTGIDIEVVAAVPGLASETDGPAEALARRITGDNGLHMVVYGTEAGQFQARDISAVVCGPGSIDQAHQPDEYIELQQLAAGESFILRLISDLSR